MVRTELAEPEPGTTKPGANEHLSVLCKPEHDKYTALSNDPDLGVTFTVTVLELPAPIVREGRLVASVRPPEPDPELPPELLPQLRVASTPLEILLTMLGFPIACT